MELRKLWKSEAQRLEINIWEFSSHRQLPSHGVFLKVGNLFLTVKGFLWSGCCVGGVVRTCLNLSPQTKAT